MKLLGLSFGRRDMNCDIAVKTALLSAQEQGADVTFINTMRLEIGHCTGCDACGRLRQKGKEPVCIIKDDFPFVERAIMDADALVVAAQVYVLGPTGQYKNVCDRIGPSHDRSACLIENERRAKEGMAPMDERYFKDRYVGLISVGGARTENWTSFGIPSMYFLTFPMQMTVVDHYNYYGAGDAVNPAFHPELLERFERMGKNVASMAGKARQDAPWLGDENGVCPVCHCNLLSIGKGVEVECPLCGIQGALEVRDGRITVDFPQSTHDRARLRPGGDMEHMLEISDMGSKWAGRMSGREQEVADLLEKLAQVTEERPR